MGKLPVLSKTTTPPRVTRLEEQAATYAQAEKAVATRRA
jgi:hypothetical protein